MPELHTVCRVHVLAGMHVRLCGPGMIHIAGRSLDRLVGDAARAETAVKGAGGYDL